MSGKVTDLARDVKENNQNFLLKSLLIEGKITEEEYEQLKRIDKNINGGQINGSKI